MKKIATCILLCFLMINLNAQQTYQYRYQLFEDYFLNPAYVGANDYYSVMFGRDQRFSGLSEASPQTYFLSVHSRVGKGYIFNKDGKINKFFKKFGNIALGLQYTQYQYGPDRETNIGLTYGYHIDLGQNYKTKNPRKLVLAFTPRLQGMWFNANDLYLIGGTVGDDNDYSYTDSGLGEYDRYRSWYFTSDVGALYQTMNFDVGVAALNIIQGKNKLETLSLTTTTDTIVTYDSLYPAKLLFNTKLKFLDVYTSDMLDLYFIPSFAMIYATKRHTSEFIINLMFESTFKKTIAGIRKKVLFTGQFGVNIDHMREYSPTTLIQPFVAFDFDNFTLTYAYSIYAHNDLVQSGAASGGNRISLIFKIKNDRIIHEAQYKNKFSRQ